MISEDDEFSKVGHGSEEPLGDTDAAIDDNETEDDAPQEAGLSEEDLKKGIKSKFEAVEKKSRAIGRLSNDLKKMIETHRDATQQELDGWQAFCDYLEGWINLSGQVIDRYSDTALDNLTGSEMLILIPKLDAWLISGETAKQAGIQVIEHHIADLYPEARLNALPAEFANASQQLTNWVNTILLS